MTYRRGNRWGLLVSIALLISLAQENVFAASIDGALKAFETGYYGLATVELRAVLTERPNDLAALYWLARCELATGDTSTAETHLRAVLAKKPTSEESLYWLGEALVAQGRTSEGLGILEKLVHINPGNVAAKQAIDRARTLPAHIDEASLGGYTGFSSTGTGIPTTTPELFSGNVYDYTFSKAPTDWVMRSGEWNATNRWTCSPQWSWYGGYAPDGIAAMWNKREFTGDIVVEMYFGFKMRMNRSPTYLPPNDMNITICGDGANPDSGYSFVIGGDENRWTRIMKGQQVLAETRELAGLWPIIEDGQPPTYEWHRKWWGIRVCKSGSKLAVYLDNKKVLEAEDPAPLPSGRVAVWTLNNDIITPRIKIYYEGEKLVRSPMPEDTVKLAPAAAFQPPAITLKSQTHPSIQNDFEAGPLNVTSRDADQGAELRIVGSGVGGSKCLQLVNRAAGGNFGATLWASQFDAANLSRLSFDYRITPDIRVNLYVHALGEDYEIVFTGCDTPSKGHSILGRIEGVETDGEWHHADFDIFGHLQALAPAQMNFECSDLWIGNLNNNDYLLAGFGANRLLANWYMDNLVIGQPAGSKLQLSIAPVNPGIVGYAIATDRNPQGQPPDTITTEDTTLNINLEDDGIWYAHVKPKRADGTWGQTATYQLAADLSGAVVKAIAPAPGSALGDEPIHITIDDPGGSGILPSTTRATFAGKALNTADATLTWDAASQEFIIDPLAANIELPASGQVTLSIEGMIDRAGNQSEPKQWNFSVDRKLDSRPPLAPQLAIQGGYLIDDTFENNTGGWKPYGGAGAAITSLDNTTAADGTSSLRLYNPTYQGRFGAYVTTERFDAGKYRIVSFDYKCDDRLRMDFALYVNGDLKGIKFTDNNDNLGVIGEVPNVQTDGHWHHAEFDLYEMLKKDDPTAAQYLIRQFILADWGVPGNRAGTTVHIDNFRIVPIVSGVTPLKVAWSGEDTSSIAGVSYIAEASGRKMPERRVMATERTFVVELGNVLRQWLTVRVQDGAGNWSTPTRRAILVDAARPDATALTPGDGYVTASSQIELGLYDNGAADIDPSSVVLNVGGKAYTTANAGLQWDRQAEKLVWNCENVNPEPVVFGDNQTVDVRLISAADYAGNPVSSLPSWSWRMSYAADTTGPALREVTSATHPTLVCDTFEDGIGLWQKRGAPYSADVEIDSSTAASGAASVKVTNQSPDGTMSVQAYTGGFSPETYPTISFDYNIPPTTKLDLLVFADNRWHAIEFSDDKQGAIGSVEGVQADGQWHHASVNLADLLRRQIQPGNAIVQHIVFADRNRKDNSAGAVAHFDNFAICKPGSKAPVVQWRATDTTGIAGYSYVLDGDPQTKVDSISEGLEVGRQFDNQKPGLLFLHIRALDGAGNWGPQTTYAMLHSRP